MAFDGLDGRLRPPAFAPGSVWLVGAGPGDPGLLTLHAAHALAAADVVLHDVLVAPEILALVRAPTRLEAVGRRAGRPGPRQLRVNQQLIALARQGLRVVRLKGGDPLVFGRGGEEALALVAAGIPFRIVPGISAGIGGTAYAGVPATHRGLAPSVAFVTGHGAGDEAGAGGGPDGVDWPALSRGAAVLVLYMALRRIGAIADRLIAAGRDPSQPLAFLSDMTTPRQQVRLATLGTAAAVASSIPSEAATLVVVGPVVALHETLTSLQQITPMEPVPERRLAVERG